MAENKPESRLLPLLTLVNDWLKYAEVKNGVLLTLNGVLLTIIHRLVESLGEHSEVLDYWLWAVTALLLLSMLVGLASFYARTKTFGFDIEKPKNSNTHNALYYGNLANMKCSDVLHRLVQKYDSACPDQYLTDLADQIIINSKIARRKFALFNFALLITIAALITPVGALLYYWGLCDDRL